MFVKENLDRKKKKEIPVHLRLNEYEMRATFMITSDAPPSVQLAGGWER